MDVLRDRRLIPLAAGALLLVVAVVIAVVVVRRRPATRGEASAHAALQVQPGKAEPHPSAGQALRCFVNGQFVGLATLAECAQRNGVASQGLDVGLDASAPPPPAPAERPEAPPGEAPAVETAAAPTTAAPARAEAEQDDAAAVGAECLRFARGDWHSVGDTDTVRVCAHALYDGVCARPGEALYGHYGPLTLRLITGQVQVSDDNRRFRTLVGQSPDCQLAD